MPIRLNRVAIQDENAWKDLVEWAKALKGGAAGVAQKVCSDLVVAAVRKAVGSLHNYQIENQVDGMLRWKKEGDEWKTFLRTGRCKVAIIYTFVGPDGTAKEVRYPALARAIAGRIEVAILNPRTGLTIRTLRTGTKARQLSAREWAVEYWPEYKMAK